MFGFDGIWKHPQSTIPALLTGVGTIAVALNWTDAESMARYASMVGGILVAIIGAFYKGTA